MKDGLAGDVGDEEGPSEGGAAEASGAEPASLVAVEDHAHMLELDDVARGFTGHDLNGVLVTEVVGALDGVEGVGLPVVLSAFFGHGRVDTALGGIGVATDGVNFGNNGYISAVSVGLKSCPHTGESRAYN